MADARACEHSYFWHPETNEQGWQCSTCGDKPGEPPGFSPQLDRVLRVQQRGRDVVMAGSMLRAELGKAV